MESSISFAEPIGFLFLHTILNWIAMMLKKFSLGSMSFLHSYLQHCACRSTVENDQLTNYTSSHLRGDESLSREEVEMAMDMVGLCCNREGEQLKAAMASDEISSLFEEKEPSLEEVNAAFRVFDENNDGFIDAGELRRVLLRLGFTEGLELDACRRMITIYDEDHDGRIGFIEFVKIMEINLC